MAPNAFCVPQACMETLSELHHALPAQWALFQPLMEPDQQALAFLVFQERILVASGPHLALHAQQEATQQHWEGHRRLPVSAVLWVRTPALWER